MNIIPSVFGSPFLAAASSFFVTTSWLKFRNILSPDRCCACRSQLFSYNSYYGKVNLFLSLTSGCLSILFGYKFNKQLDFESKIVEPESMTKDYFEKIRPQHNKIAIKIIIGILSGFFGAIGFGKFLEI
jgi:hypothetical protein